MIILICLRCILSPSYTNKEEQGFYIFILVLKIDCNCKIHNIVLTVMCLMERTKIRAVYIHNSELIEWFNVFCILWAHYWGCRQQGSSISLRTYWTAMDSIRAVQLYLPWYWRQDWKISDAWLITVLCSFIVCRWQSTILSSKSIRSYNISISPLPPFDTQ